MEKINFKPLYFFIADFIILPYVRMTQRTKFYPVASRYLKNHTDLRLRMIPELERQHRSPLLNGLYMPDDFPFQLVMLVNFMSDKHNCDLDNLVKSVLDASAGLIFKNDRFCDGVYARRYFKTYDQDLILFAYAGLDEDPVDILDQLYYFPVSSASDHKPALVPLRVRSSSGDGVKRNG